MALDMENVTWYLASRLIGHKRLAPKAHQTLCRPSGTDIREDERNIFPDGGPMGLLHFNVARTGINLRPDFLLPQFLLCCIQNELNGCHQRILDGRPQQRIE
jgi:hypothetical protein